MNEEVNCLNTGKRFEADFKASIPAGFWYYRFKDNPAAYYGGGQEGLRFASDNICDCQIYKAPFLHLIELKTVGTPSAPLASLFGRYDTETGRYKKQKHLEDMAQATEHAGITASVVIHFRLTEHTYAVPAADVLAALQRATEGDRKSLPEQFCRERGVLVAQRRLRVNWRYDVESLVHTLETREGTNTKNLRFDNAGNRRMLYDAPPPEPLLRQLRVLAVECRPTACLGCGYEQGCSLHGCAVIRKALELLEGGSKWEMTATPPEPPKEGDHDPA